ncbi:LexA family transcriptional regulator [Azospirillum sp. B4]|uniref:LexA family protein n=1 Tax=Azospirillum sp. B4 TaxID=95605 RepID=UPI0020786D1D|nr:S24 family peptidase [Azospirillum sp. B4]
MTLADRGRPDAPLCLPAGQPSLPVATTCTLMGLAVEAWPLELPMVVARAACGFPSPAADHVEGRLDLMQLLVPHPAATYMLRASGSSMRGAGILDGAILICDRSVAPKHGDIVVAAVDGSLVVKRLWARGGKVELRSEPDPGDAAGHPPLLIQEGDGSDEAVPCIVWGPVTGLAMRF